MTIAIREGTIPILASSALIAFSAGGARAEEAACNQVWDATFKSVATRRCT